MVTKEQVQFGVLLDALARELDISPSAYDAAETHYKAVTDWLKHENSMLLKYSPDLYPQGSFRLGTIIKPVSDKDDYDLDVVCELANGDRSLTQRGLKTMIGARLREHPDYRRMLEPEGRRCWTVTYADNTRFHMDVLPAISDKEFILLERSVPTHISQEAILITDTTAVNDLDWPRSNPRGYAMWFEDQMRIQFDIQRRTIMEAKGFASVEKVPPQAVRTPLQRAIQLLKRHRDQTFGDDEDKPISMIITTLAARAYRNQDNIYDALTGVVAGMRNYVEVRQGVYWVSNPVNPAENYADKWREHPKRATKLFQWLGKVEADLNSALERRGLQFVAEQLRPCFGEGAVGRAVKHLGETTYAQRKDGRLLFEAGTGMLGVSSGTKVKDHTFYGE